MEFCFFMSAKGHASPYINHFLQPDNIIPDYTNPQALNRYSYVGNRPVNFNDPTGHVIACDEEMSASECKKERKLANANTVGEWKSLIKEDFGIEMSSEKHEWDVKNLEVVYFGLLQIDGVLSGKIKSFSKDLKFMLDGSAYGTYSGYTTGKTIIFYTGSTIPTQNLYHEFGHLLDNIFNDIFTNKLRNDPRYAGDGSYLFGGDSVGIINAEATLTNPFRVNDPNWTNGIVSLQHPSGDPVEQWGDMFANYVAGNIDMSKPSGQNMYNTVNDYLMTGMGR